MTELDLPQEDMEFLNSVTNSLNSTSSEEGMLSLEETAEWIIRCTTTENQYQEMYARIGKRMLANLAASKFVQGNNGARFYGTLLADEVLGKEIMDFAAAYGHVCFTEGYELGKEAAGEA